MIKLDTPWTTKSKNLTFTVFYPSNTSIYFVFFKIMGNVTPININKIILISD